ncbi:MAG: hypothetical protein ABF285_14085 [Pacificibacter sp.]|uniref:COG4223 family protein n=1 Tax=Pacificibacter sp. TaxID=1917866 RepID=UPI00321A6DC6
MAGAKKTPNKAAIEEADIDAVNVEKDDVVQADAEGEDTLEATADDADAASADTADVSADSDDAKSVEETDISDETPEVSDLIHEEPATAAPVSSAEQRGFMPLLLGGVLCAGIGFVAANLIKPDGWPFPGSNTEVLKEQIAQLETSLADTRAQMETVVSDARKEAANVSTSVDEKLAEFDLDGTIETLSAALASMDQRLTAVEAAPVAEAIVSPEATAAYERQLSEMQSLLDSEVARLKEAKEVAESEKASAAMASALTRLQEAVTNGQPFAGVLTELPGEVPSALAGSAATGVATLQEIADSFSDAAEVAIVETAKSDTENQGWMDRFLRSQLGLRSLTPQEGTTPDAILSRAEQAIRDNDLQVALTEISTLPDVGQAAMADWAAMTRTRLDVTTALSALLAQ